VLVLAVRVHMLKYAHMVLSPLERICIQEEKHPLSLALKDSFVLHRKLARLNRSV
jgi:hypothetical protein